MQSLKIIYERASQVKKDTLINIILSSLSALLLILSSAGFGFSFLVFVAFVPVLFAVKRGGVHPLFSGWIMGFLYWVVCLSWMTVTFSRFGGAPLAASVGLLLFISVLGGLFFFAPFTYVARKYSCPLLLSTVFIALEALKGTFFFAGVPWLNLAQSQYKNILILQFVSWFGELGLSFIIMAINVLIFLIITNNTRKKYAAFLCFAVLFMITPGIIRAISPLHYKDIKKVKIIQPGYKQEDKWQRDKQLAIIRDLNNRLSAVQKGKYDLVVLPESSYPARLLDTPFIMDVVAKAAENAPIIAGTDRKITGSNGEVKDFFNSMVLIESGGKTQIYDKTHLTPFGEYFPFENLLSPIKKFFFGPGKMFSAGTRQTILLANEMKIAPLICFESGFSDLLKIPVQMGANMIAIISNDSWFGKNQGRVQHFAVNVMRSAEYGRAAVVATQDGISGFIMPDGSAALTITEQKPAEAEYDVPLVEERTIYSYIRYIWIAFVIAIVYYLMKKGRKQADDRT